MENDEEKKSKIFSSIRINKKDKKRYFRVEKNIFNASTLIEKESKEPAGVYISYENAGTNASCLCGMTENKDSSKLYFKCEVLKKPDTPAYMVVGIKNGQVTNMSGNKIDFDKDVRLEF